MQTIKQIGNLIHQSLQKQSYQTVRSIADLKKNPYIVHMSMVLNHYASIYHVHLFGLILKRDVTPSRNMEFMRLAQKKLIEHDICRFCI